jgi:hypothetical protein
MLLRWRSESDAVAPGFVEEEHCLPALRFVVRIRSVRPTRDAVFGGMRELRLLHGGR